MNEQELLLRIRAIADLKDADKANAAVRDLRAEVAKPVSKGGLFGGIAEGLRDMKAAFQGAGGGLDGALNAMAAGGTKAALALSATATAAMVTRHAVEEYAQAEQKVAALDAALANHGHLTEANRVRYQEAAAALQDLTGVADDQWVPAMERIVQMGGRPESLGVDMDAVKNLAGLLNGDVQQAAVMYGRALQGNFDMFKRLGIEVREHGSLMEKLGDVQAQAALKGGGRLEAMNQTLAGQYRQLKNNAGDFFEAIGRGISLTGGLQATTYGLSETFKFLAGSLGGVVPKVDGLKNAQGAAARTAAELEAKERDAKGQLDQLGKSAEEAAKKHDRLRDSINQVTVAQIALTDAELARDTAAIDDQVKLFESTGGQRGISAAEGERQKAALRQRAEENKFKLEQDARIVGVQSDEQRLKDLETKAAQARNNVTYARQNQAAFEQAVRPAQQNEQRTRQEWIDAEGEVRKAEAELAAGSTGPSDLAAKQQRVAAAKAEATRLRQRARAAKEARQRVEQQFEEAGMGQGSRDVGAAERVAATAQTELERGRETLTPRIEAGRREISTREAERQFRRPATAISDIAPVLEAQRKELDRLRVAASDPGRAAAGAAPLTGEQFAAVLTATNVVADILNQVDALRSRLPALSEAAKTDPAKARELAALLANIQRLHAQVAGIMQGVSQTVTPAPGTPGISPAGGPPVAAGPQPGEPPARQPAPAYTARQREILEERLHRDEANLQNTGDPVLQEVYRRKIEELRRQLGNMRVDFSPLEEAVLRMQATLQAQISEVGGNIRDAATRANNMRS